MRTLMLFLMLPLVSACSPVLYGELGAGFNTNLFGNADWNDGGAGPTGAYVETGVLWDLDAARTWQTECRWIHISQWTVGPPWNNKAEDTVDHLGCAVRKEFR